MVERRQARIVAWTLCRVAGAVEAAGVRGVCARRVAARSSAPRESPVATAALGRQPGRRTTQAGIDAVEEQGFGPALAKRSASKTPLLAL